MSPPAARGMCRRFAAAEPAVAAAATCLDGGAGLAPEAFDERSVGGWNPASDQSCM